MAFINEVFATFMRDSDVSASTGVAPIESAQIFRAVLFVVTSHRRPDKSIVRKSDFLFTSLRRSSEIPWAGKNTDQLIGRRPGPDLRISKKAVIFYQLKRFDQLSPMEAERLSRLHIDGIVPIIPTPFHDTEEIDWAALRNLLDFAVAADVEAVCLPAYASEFYKLSEAERREAIVFAAGHLKGKIPLIAQVNHPSTLHAARAVREAQQDGASAVCCAVPRMFALDEGALEKHFGRILQAIDVPLIIQDFNPGGSSVSPRFLAQLHRTHAHFRYAKLEEPLMAAKVEAILEETSGEVGVLEGWGGMYMLELIPAGISGVMPGLGICDVLGRAFRLAKRGESDRACELFQGVLPQIAFCLENMELFHHAEKLLLQARGIISRAIVRQATRTLHEADANHIQFLNAKILILLDHFGFARNPARQLSVQPS